MSAGYEIDRLSYRFKKVSRSVGEWLKVIVRYLLVTVSLSVFYYCIFSFFVSTDTERRLRRENRMYEQLYPSLKAQTDLIGDVLEGLELKDGQIYDEIFHAKAPALNPVGSMADYTAVDSISSRDIEAFIEEKVVGAEAVAARVEDNFRRIIQNHLMSGSVLPPLSLPLKDISYPQVGASVGSKVNPFYKVEVQHYGLDFVAEQGDAVYASAEGTVSSVSLSRKGQGNVVEIEHDGGYVTRYAHLGDVDVSKGQKVARGRKIGTVGISGSSFAPHLHYELLKDGVYLDPVYYLFASVSPEEYANMLYMASRTGQSLD